MRSERARSKYRPPIKLTESRYVSVGLAASRYVGLFEHPDRRCFTVTKSALLNRALDHAHSIVEMHALINPRITEVVEDVRLIGKQFESLLEIGFRLRPLLCPAPLRRCA